MYLFLYLISPDNLLLKKRKKQSRFIKSQLNYEHRIHILSRTVWRPHRGFQFNHLCMHLIFSFQSKRRSQGLSLDTIYHCLNRTVLYQLCRAHKTVAQQVALLDALRVLTVNRNLVLGPGNHDQDFVACLAHCFICLHSGRWARKACSVGGTVVRWLL